MMSWARKGWDSSDCGMMIRLLAANVFSDLISEEKLAWQCWEMASGMFASTLYSMTRNGEDECVWRSDGGESRSCFEDKNARTVWSLALVFLDRRFNGDQVAKVNFVQYKSKGAPALQILFRGMNTTRVNVCTGGCERRRQLLTIIPLCVTLKRWSNYIHYD